MAYRSTRSSGKRNANEVTPTSPPTSPHKQGQSQKRSKVEKPKPSSTSINKKSSDDSEDLQIVECTGDIFDAPPNTLIMHACNCDGSWGAGIAAAFKDRYPKAYMQYVYNCEEYDHKLFDHAQLIPPVDAFEAGTQDEGEGFNESSSRPGNETKADVANGGAAKHFVGCLFTSRHYGRRRDKPARILAATAPAMVDLLRKVNEWNAKAEDSEKVGEVRMCKINSGLFAVPWGRTKAVLEKIDVTRSDVKVIKVVSPPG